MSKPKFFDRLKNAKAADTPRRAEKVYHPRGTGLRKAGMWAFWMLMSFIALSFLMNLLFGQNEEAAVLEDEPENPAMTQEAAAFATEFTEVYFSWNATAAGWADQQAKLSAMLGQGVPETAGIMQADQTWNSRAADMQLIDMEATGPNKSLVTIKVDQLLTRQKEVTEAGVKPETETKRATHFFTVPVAYDVAFGVYDLPSFTAIEEENAVEREVLKGDAAPADAEQNLKNFLPTFFQSYATDAPDKLAYVLQTGEDVKGLEGSVEFESVTDATVTQNQPGDYEVEALVVMKEPATGTRFTTVYRLTVQEKDGRYVVTKLNQGAE